MFKASDISFKLLILVTLIIFSIHVSYGEEKNPFFVPVFYLNDGNSIPAVGLGTSRAKSEESEQAIKDAIDSGYRHIDTAYVYENEVQVGNAVRAKITDGTIKREDIFVTTKLGSTFHEPEWVDKQFEVSFNNLNLTYIKLFLMHTPMTIQRISKTTNKTAETVEDTSNYPLDANGKVPGLDVDYIDTWKKMEELLETGRVKSLGVSNFNSHQLDRLIRLAKIKPTVNQIECHPNLNQHKLIEFSKKRDILTICYSPLGRPDSFGDRKIALKDPIVLQIGEKYNKTPAQILLRFLIRIFHSLFYQNGAAVIPKSVKKHRIQENVNIFDFSLNDEDMQTLYSLDKNLRLISFSEMGDVKYFPFNIEF